MLLRGWICDEICSKELNNPRRMAFSAVSLRAKEPLEMSEIDNPQADTRLHSRLPARVFQEISYGWQL